MQSYPAAAIVTQETTIPTVRLPLARPLLLQFGETVWLALLMLF
jgi:hypothetical protein